MHDGTQELLCMSMDRRRLFAAFAGVATAGAATPAPARDSTAMPRAEIDATALRLRPNAQEDQSTILQRAIERARGRGRSGAATATRIFSRRCATIAALRRRRRCLRHDAADHGRRPIAVVV